MKQQVNLYTDAFRPSREWLTLGAVMTVVALVLVVIAGISGWNQYRIAQLQSEQRVLQDQVQQAEKTVERLNSRVAEQRENQELVAQVERLEQRVSDRKRLIARADSVAQASSEGFTPYLRGLAEQSRQGLWLTRIEVNLIRDHLELNGRTREGRNVLEYLQRLRQEPVFEGRRFARFEIERDAGEAPSPLVFTVASQPDSDTEGD